MLEIVNICVLEIYNIMGTENTHSNPSDLKRHRLLWFITLLTLLLVSLTIISYGLILLSDDQTALGVVMIVVGIAIIMVGGITIRIWNIRLLKGRALQDELSTLVLYKSGYYSFVATFYVMVLMITLLNIVETPRFVIYIGMGLNLLIFIIIHTIVRRMDFS